MNARTIHHNSELAREQGDFLHALQLLSEAIIAYIEADDLLGLAEAYASQVLAFRHLYQKTDKKIYLKLVVGAAKTSVKIAEEIDQPQALGLPLFNLAKAYEDIEKWDHAVEYYKKAIKAIEEHPPKEHGPIEAILADMRAHCAYAEYLNGNTKAWLDLEDAIADLELIDFDRYRKDVWISGAHMSMAKMLMKDNRSKAEEHLEKAKEIIEGNADLKLRAGQWEKLAKEFENK